MMTKRIKALLQFIDFLHSNIENFKQHDQIVNELRLLDKERQKTKPRNNYKDKLKFDELQAEIEEKFKAIQDNIWKPILTKAEELNVCEWNNTGKRWDFGTSEISELKQNLRADDIPKIVLHKNKYLEFRTKTNCTLLQDMFFSDLDEDLNELFVFFTDSEDELKQIENTPVKKVSIPFSVISKNTSTDLTAPKKATVPQQSEDKPNKHTGKQHAVTYVLDCKAQKQKPVTGKKLEEKGKELTNGKKSGNTFYKNYLEIVHEDFTKETSLIQLLGEDWRSIVLELSTDTERLKSYIKEQF